MKAYESSERYEGKVRECCNYAARTAKNFATAGSNTKRQPCGSDEKKLAEALKTDLEGFADTVIEDRFTADQQAYILSNLLVFIFMLISAAAGVCACIFSEYAFWILIGAVVFAFLALLGFFGVFGGTSKNVAGQNIFAVRNANGDVKKRVILEANLDAPFKRTCTPKTAVIFKLVTFIGILLYIAFDIVSLLVNKGNIDFSMSDKFIFISFPLVIFAIFPLILSRSVNANASFPGVVDNLVGCYTAAGALRYMSEMDLRLEQTELCVLLTGAKNANHTGAKTYCKLHEPADKAVETVVISLDSLFNAETISIITNNKLSTDVMAVASTNADVNILEYDPKYIKKNGSMKVFKKNKYSCATIASLTDKMPAYFGTKSDDESNINVKAIENAMKLCLEAAYKMDE
ncbi:MAG: M28 family peptidase [Clostridia bacterium]|nr:M28 family peptidase [Clostridia bacterium]